MANVKCTIIDRGKLSESEAQIYVNAANRNGTPYFIYKDAVSFADGIKTFKNRLSLSDVVEWIEIISHGSAASLDNFIIGGDNFYALAKNLNELKSRFSQNSKIYLSGCNTGRTKSSQDRCIADLLSQEVPCSILGTVGWVDGSITQNPAEVITICEKIVNGIKYNLGQGDCLEAVGDKCWIAYEKDRLLFSSNKISTIVIQFAGMSKLFVPEDLIELQKLVSKRSSRPMNISSFRANPDINVIYHFHGYSVKEFGLFIDIPLILSDKKYFMLSSVNHKIYMNKIESYIKKSAQLFSENNKKFEDNRKKK